MRARNKSNNTEKHLTHITGLVPRRPEPRTYIGAAVVVVVTVLMAIVVCSFEMTWLATSYSSIYQVTTHLVIGKLLFSVALASR